MKELAIFMDCVKKTLNPTMEAWKNSGKKIIGYVCTNVPEEIILAAGMLPYRIRAPESREVSESDRYLTYLNCSYCRHLVSEALGGKYDFLDGFVGTNGCDQMRRISDIFRAAAFKERIEERCFLTEFIGAPRVPFDSASEEYYKGEMTRMKEKIEEFSGVEITAEALREAIKRVNDARRLLHELYALRKTDVPPVSGAESLAITIAYSCMPKDAFIAQLKTLLNGLAGRVAVPKYRKRIFLYGSELDDPSWVQVIEDQGGIVVADGLCFGARMFWDLVDESLEPMAALARRYYTRWPCPRVTDRKGRQKRVREVIRDWKVDGLIGERLMFCQPWGAERVATEMESRETGIPNLWLDREYVLGGVGQIRTRVQAFLESME
ncbi:MAG: 2-hydroxyacyl-CoA dehydratase family protein [bacterium]